MWLFGQTENTTSCWDTSNEATVESDITQYLSERQVFWCQSLEIKAEGVLSTYWQTMTGWRRNLWWKRMSSFPVTAASWDQKPAQLEDSLGFESEKIKNKSLLIIHYLLLWKTYIPVLWGCTLENIEKPKIKLTSKHRGREAPQKQNNKPVLIVSVHKSPMLL